MAVRLAEVHTAGLGRAMAQPYGVGVDAPYAVRRIRAIRHDDHAECGLRALGVDHVAARRSLTRAARRTTAALRGASSPIDAAAGPKTSLIGPLLSLATRRPLPKR